MRVWQSSRGSQKQIPLDKEAESALRMEQSTYVPSVDNVSDSQRVTNFLHELGFRREWNTRVGLDVFVSFWRMDEKILLFFWDRRSGAIEICLPIAGETLEDLLDIVRSQVVDLTP